MMDLLTLLLGLALALAGGHALVVAAIDLARRLGVPPLLIGLTVVAWGTSLPEMAFDIASSLAGRPDLVFGDLVGSNVANIGLVLGAAAIATPALIKPVVVRRDLPAYLALSILLLLLVLVEPREGRLVFQLKGAVLMTLFAAYSVFTILDGLRGRAKPPPPEATVPGGGAEKPPRSGWLVGTLLFAGITLLIVGGQMASASAASIARDLGVSETVVAITIVGTGTSLPELVTTIVAARSRHSDIAVGNVVGSCIVNIGFPYALSRIISPAPAPEGAALSLLWMLGTVALLLGMAIVSQGRVTRREGLVLLACYVGFIGHELAMAR